MKKIVKFFRVTQQFHMKFLIEKNVLEIKLLSPLPELSEISEKISLNVSNCYEQTPVIN